MCLAIPGQVLSIEGDDPLERTGAVAFGAVRKHVSLAYVPDARVGDYVLVHAGFAIACIDEDAARRTLEYVLEIDDAGVDLGEDFAVKHVDEYRDARRARRTADAITRTARRDWTIMEVCGGQTHAILKYGIDDLLPPNVRLIHGPGCPVCVTPAESIDQAILIASSPGVILCSFGDMLRVPGSRSSLLDARARGADVRIVYSPLDAVRVAREQPDRQVVFFAVGFETTAPTTAMAAYSARRDGLENFSLLVSHVLVPPAMEAILASESSAVQGFLAAGHVCTVMGFAEYEPIAARHRVPIVVTGFEPLDILQGVYMCVRQLEQGRHEVENQYTRSVRREGNAQARRLLAEVFRVVPRRWRGVGEIAASGLSLAGDYAHLDAERRFGMTAYAPEEPSRCKSGLVLQGRLRPDECEAFGTECTPEHPLGATMVSSEGACAAYWRYRRRGAGRMEPHNGR